MRIFTLLVFSLININFVYGLAFAAAPMTTVQDSDSAPVTTSSLDAMVLPAIDTSAGVAAQQLSLKNTILPCPCETNKWITNPTPCSNGNLLLTHLGHFFGTTVTAWTICLGGTILPTFNYAKVYGHHCGPHCDKAYAFNFSGPGVPSWTGPAVQTLVVGGKTMRWWIRGVHFSTCCSPAGSLYYTKLTWP